MILFSRHLGRWNWQIVGVSQKITPIERFTGGHDQCNSELLSKNKTKTKTKIKHKKKNTKQNKNKRQKRNKNKKSENKSKQTNKYACSASEIENIQVNLMRRWRHHTWEGNGHVDWNFWVLQDFFCQLYRSFRFRLDSISPVRT